ncbi:hypothetical protein HGA64_02475 [Candidatus Falkowbacteria bacterium]|nr:hypothetical protein [Candidatus Falkowbacteria bacterium]
MTRIAAMGMFFLFAFLILFGAHFFIYISWIALAKPDSKHVWPAIIFLFLASISFIVASVLVHFGESLPARVLYFLSGGWLGYLLYLILSLVFVWLIYGLWLIFFSRTSFPGGSLWLVALFISLGLTLYGVWNARHPQLIRKEVAIRNLPLVWQEQKVVQLSDVHLGAIHGLSFMDMVSDKVNGENAKAVLITGDYFETTTISWADDQYGQGPAGTAIRTGQAVAANHILTNPQFYLWRTQAIKNGYAAI